MKKLISFSLLIMISVLSFSQDIDKEKENRAFGDAYFDMPWKEAKDCKVFNDKNYRFKKYRMPDYKYMIGQNYEIGGGEYRVRCYFDNDSLSSVIIDSDWLRDEYEKATKREFLTLKDIFSDQYGKPTIDPGYLPIAEQSNSSFTVWKYGEKEIKLAVIANKVEKNILNFDTQITGDYYNYKVEAVISKSKQEKVIRAKTPVKL